MSIFSNHRISRCWSTPASIASALALLVMNILVAVPLPPLGKVDVVGTVAEAEWVPKASLKGKKGMSGSLGRDRVVPAHFVVILRSYSGPTARQAWMMNGFVGVKTDASADRSKPPQTLTVWVNSDDRHFLEAGMKIRLVNYSVAGDEGGTWTSCDRVERSRQKPSAGAAAR